MENEMLKLYRSLRNEGCRAIVAYKWASFQVVARMAPYYNY